MLVIFAAAIAQSGQLAKATFHGGDRMTPYRSVHSSTVHTLAVYAKLVLTLFVIGLGENDNCRSYRA